MYATMQQALEEAEIEKGMEEKSEEFKELGSEVYL